MEKGKDKQTYIQMHFKPNSCMCDFYVHSVDTTCVDAIESVIMNLLLCFL